jgi:hypothetical protein
MIYSPPSKAQFTPLKEALFIDADPQIHPMLLNVLNPLV